MDKISTAEDGRFCSNASDVLVTNVSGSLKGNCAIIDAIVGTTSSDISQLMQGLATESQKDTTLNLTWDAAENIYKADKSKYAPYKRPDVPRELHIALIAYVLAAFYPKFNETTRKLRSIAEVRNYPYKHYFKLLLLAVVRVRGLPESLEMDVELYRGLSGGKLNATVGSELALQQFTSTSRDRGVAKGYAGTGDRTLLVFKNIMPSGVDLARLLGTPGCPNVVCCDHIGPHNKECLIWPCEIFKVTRVEPDQPNGLRVIHLTANSSVEHFKITMGQLKQNRQNWFKRLKGFTGLKINCVNPSVKP